MRKRQLGWVGVAFSSVMIASVLGAAPASAGAFVFYPEDCGWTPGSVEGVEDFIPATYCQIVGTPSGKLMIRAQGELPEGFTLTQAYVNLEDCDGTSSLVATPSGRLTANCVLTLE